MSPGVEGKLELSACFWVAAFLHAGEVVWVLQGHLALPVLCLGNEWRKNSTHCSHMHKYNICINTISPYPIYHSMSLLLMFIIDYICLNLQGRF